MTRLSIGVREKIISALMIHRFADRIHKLSIERAEIAGAIYADVFGKDLLRMNALPEGWLPERANFCVRHGGSYEEYHFNGRLSPDNMRKFVDRNERVIRRFPYDKYQTSCIATYDGTHVMAMRCEANRLAVEQLNKEIIAADKLVGATLIQAGTIKRLVEIWPEIKPFTDPFDTPVAKPLAVQTDRLNEVFKLP